MADSLSATAPGYHYTLAGASFLTGPGRLPLRLINFGVSLGILALLWRCWPAGSEPRTAWLALLPLTASNFVVKSASYVVTDNAALLTITGVLVALFFLRRETAPQWASGLATAAVLIRQSSLWLVAPLGTYLWGSGGPWRSLLLVFPPIAALLWLVASWQGLVPPAWQANHYAQSGLVPAAGAYMLALLAMFGTGYYLTASASICTKDWFNSFSGLGLLGGIGMALAGPNTLDYDAGRWGGYLWDIAEHLPKFGPYSLLFLVMAPLGGAILGLLVRRLWLELSPSVAGTWLTAYLSWAAAGLSNRQVFHRYFEPVTLVLLICWLVLLVRARPAGEPLQTKPLVALGVFQLLVTLGTAHGRTFGLY